MLDNVDNILSFRLSGQEAEMLRQHIGADEDIVRVLQGMEAGEFILKNRFLRSALPIRAEEFRRQRAMPHVTDERIAQAQRAYLLAHVKDYCPYTICESTGCAYCSAAVRETANMYAAQLFAGRQKNLKKPEEIAAHIIRVPELLSERGRTDPASRFPQICRCTAVHLLRKCSAENGISFGGAAAARLLSDVNNRLNEGGFDHG